ncbi:MAG: CarD family transcriptional regulator [Lachnospiraceae bacterium]|nr:CarD family transcriptional regulator [Lachnospiraceae bacterium]
MPYKISDLVHYGTDGVCSITDIIEKPFRDSMVKYYVLSPVFNASATIFVPLDNQKLISERMRYALTPAEIKKIISETSSDDDIWIDNETERKARYKEIIQSGDSREILKIVYTLSAHQEQQKALGKKMHIADERFFKDAERLINNEFAAVLGILPSEVFDYIRKSL